MTLKKEFSNMSDEEWGQYVDFCNSIKASTQEDAEVIKASIEMDKEEIDRLIELARPEVVPSKEALDSAKMLVNDLIKQLFASGDEVNVAKAAAVEEQKVFMIKQLAKGYQVELDEG